MCSDGGANTLIGHRRRLTAHLSDAGLTAAHEGAGRSRRRGRVRGLQATEQGGGWAKGRGGGLRAKLRLNMHAARKLLLYYLTLTSYLHHAGLLWPPGVTPPHVTFVLGLALRTPPMEPHTEYTHCKKWTLPRAKYNNRNINNSLVCVHAVFAVMCADKHRNHIHAVQTSVLCLHPTTLVSGCLLIVPGFTRGDNGFS